RPMRFSAGRAPPRSTLFPYTTLFRSDERASGRGLPEPGKRCGGRAERQVEAVDDEVVRKGSRGPALRPFRDGAVHGFERFVSLPRDGRRREVATGERGGAATVHGADDRSVGAVVHGDLVVADDPVVCAASGRLPTLFVSGSAARSDAGGRLVDLAGHLHADHPGERLRLPATDAATAGDRVTALDLVLVLDRPFDAERALQRDSRQRGAGAGTGLRRPVERPVPVVSPSLTA